MRALVLAAALVGCSSPTTGHPFDPPPALPAADRSPVLDYEGGWSADEEGAIAAGFAEWPTHAQSTELHIWRVTATDAQSDHCPSASPEQGVARLGQTYGAHDMCLYTQEIGPSLATLQQVAAHEYGHALGVHFDNPADPAHYAGAAPSIMFADIEQSATTVQAVDMAAPTGFWQ